MLMRFWPKLRSLTFLWSCLSNRFKRQTGNREQETGTGFFVLSFPILQVFLIIRGVVMVTITFVSYLGVNSSGEGGDAKINSHMCVLPPQGPQCHCQPGWTGQYCDQPLTKSPTGSDVVTTTTSANPCEASKWVSETRFASLKVSPLAHGGVGGACECCITVRLLCSQVCERRMRGSGRANVPLRVWEGVRGSAVQLCSRLLPRSAVSARQLCADGGWRELRLRARVHGGELRCRWVRSRESRFRSAEGCS